MNAKSAPVDSEVESHYASATNACLVVEHTAPGVLAARGRTVLDFLQRMSTNDVLGLGAWESRGTVLTNAIGRIVDVIRVLHRPSDVLLLTSPGAAHVVRDWLARYIFFNDDVSLSEVETTHALWGLYGPKASASLQDLAGREILILDSDVVEFDGGMAWRGEPGLDGLQILLDSEGEARAHRLWGDRGPGSAALDAYQAFRIERGLPEPGREISAEVLPLEVGLWSLVNFRKGCYIGQEVIARMESRGQVARGLVGVRLDQLVETPQEIENEGRVLGRLTSVALSPRLGPIGLALIRTSAHGSDLAECRLAPSGATARLSPLPL